MLELSRINRRRGRGNRSRGLHGVHLVKNLMQLCLLLRLLHQPSAKFGRIIGHCRKNAGAPIRVGDLGQVLPSVKPVYTIVTANQKASVAYNFPAPTDTATATLLNLGNVALSLATDFENFTDLKPGPRKLFRPTAGNVLPCGDAK